MMYGNSEWTGSYTALFYSTPALRVFYTKVFLYWRHAWQWLYGAAEQWQWHECENTYGGFLWRKGVQLFRVQTWRIRVEAVLVTPYCEALRWFFHYCLSHLSCLILIVKEYIGLLTVVWNIFFDLVFFRSDCVTLMFPRDITTTKSQHTSQNGNYFYCFPISLWVSMSKLSAHPISGGIGQDGLCHSLTVLVPTQLPGSRFDGDGQGQAATVTHHPVHTRHVG